MASTLSRTAPTTIAGKPVGRVGYGMLGLTIPPALETEAAIQVLKTALDQGANFWNGSLFYGTAEYNSLHLLKAYFEKYPEDANKVVISIKGCYTHQTGPDCSPEGVRASFATAIAILPPDLKKIDIFQCARVDPNVPYETSIKALMELVQEGKIGGIGASEVSASTLRKAHAIHPIAAAEIELSLFTPDALHNDIRDTCLELNIPFTAYSPVGRGFLTGEIRKLDDLAENDFRRMMPRFQPEHFAQNLKLVDAVEQIAKRKGLITAQVAIGWVCSQGTVPIPGSKIDSRIKENCKPATLTESELGELQQVLDTIPVSGGRYPAAFESMLNG